MSENTMLDLAREVMIGFGEYCGMEITAIDGEELYARMPLRPEFLNVPAGSVRWPPCGADRRF